MGVIIDPASPITLRTLLVMDLHQPFEYLAGSFCVPKSATFPQCLAVKSLVFLQSLVYRFSEKFTCIWFDTERLTLLAHSVLVLALSYTSLTTFLCHRSFLCIGTRVVILILLHRSTWCRLLLIARSGCSTCQRSDSSDARCASCRGELPTWASPYSLKQRCRPLGLEWV